MKTRNKLIIKLVVYFLLSLTTVFIGFMPIVSEHMIQEGLFNRMVNQFIFPIWVYGLILFSSGFFCKSLMSTARCLDNYDNIKIGEKNEK